MFRQLLNDSHQSCQMKVIWQIPTWTWQITMASCASILSRINGSLCMSETTARHTNRSAVSPADTTRVLRRCQCDLAISDNLISTRPVAMHRSASTGGLSNLSGPREFISSNASSLLRSCLTQ